jgi:ABC-type bacteriocin/lantibiotic exporter with double-glycine peptidase domain
LLDDPLSAVEAHLDDHLFSRALSGDFCHHMTRIIVTHHVHFLPRCDRVIVMEKGEIQQFGAYPTSFQMEVYLLVL